MLTMRTPGMGVVSQRVVYGNAMLELKTPEPIPAHRKKMKDKQRRPAQSPILPVAMRADELTEGDIAILHQEATKIQSAGSPPKIPRKIPYGKRVASGT